MPRKPITKYCSKCEQDKPIAEFSKAAREMDGLQRWCRPCMRAYNKRKYWEDPEKGRQRVKDYADEHRDEVRKRYRRLYWANPEKYRQLSAANQRLNPDRVRAYRLSYWQMNKIQLSEKSRAHRDANPELYQQKDRNAHQRRLGTRRAYGKAYYHAHTEAMSLYRKEWNRRNPDRVFEWKARRHAAKLSTQVERINRAIVIERDGSACYICGKVLERHEITIDHVIPLSKGGSHTYDNLRVACRPCNSRKWNHLPGEYTP